MLEELAKRCEEATGADRELDADIFQTIGGKPWEIAYNDATKPCGCPHDMAVTDARRRAPYFTSSIDAALTLVPEGFDWIIGNVNGHVGGTPYATVGPFDDRYASTPVLALCAASLRAIAGLGDSK